MARIWLSLLPIVGPVAAMQADARTVGPGPFCTELRRIVAATRDTPSFASLAAAPAALPGLENACAVLNDRHGVRFRCEIGPSDLATFDRLTTDTGRCLPHAIRRPDETGPRLAQFRLATAAIIIRQDSLPGDGAGIDLSYSVYPIPIH